MKVLLVFAHADDETIFGYPYFQRGDIQKTLLVCSTDSDHPRYGTRIPVLKGICDRTGVDLHTVDSRSNFYSLPTLNGSLQRFYSQVREKVERLQEDCDLIFTHNPHGEYGHPDHKVVFEIVAACARVPVHYSDIWVEQGHSLLECNELYYTDLAEHSEIDLDLYESTKSEYKSADVWTWVEEPIRRCCIYRLPTR